MLFFWTLFIEEFGEKKCIMVSAKIFSSTAVFNIENNKKYLLSSKSAFLKKPKKKPMNPEREMYYFLQKY